MPLRRLYLYRCFEVSPILPEEVALVLTIIANVLQITHPAGPRRIMCGNGEHALAEVLPPQVRAAPHDANGQRRRHAQSDLPMHKRGLSSDVNVFWGPPQHLKACVQRLRLRESIDVDLKCRQRRRHAQSKLCQCTTKRAMERAKVEIRCGLQGP